MTALTVLETGPLATIQDRGRSGQAALGVPGSGACDPASYALANRLVGNHPGASALEITFGGLVLHADTDLTIAITGAPCIGVPLNAPAVLRAGEVLRFGPPRSGLRTYLAVRGGIDVPPVLGSRSTDLLSGLGPAPLQPGQTLPIGCAHNPMPGVDLAPVADPPAGEVVLRVTPGPRRDWFTDAGWTSFITQTYDVSSNSNRVGVRLDGNPLERARDGELASEGMALGAIQIPPSGLPVIFLADHPVTGGYPVIAYLTAPSIPACAQLRPGQSARFSC
ncbi:biotin-dependent carboxyltransferase family protein [Kribbella qitaiheensis]|uniref:Biotin-dependent carboxyltransferase family protein n=1 Tax=Kribbella qitaiheensis TaxID=1544730 RepID=A0A7G6WZG5_9ACTN|nr:biotin-dependent carboxyltransferase family protein [Kribbella qitaiheensis]QNE19380.1 biotin-dependent carboxyltransferase family protein [Kribbella qitaiheensis]